MQRILFREVVSSLSIYGSHFRPDSTAHEGHGIFLVFAIQEICFTALNDVRHDRFYKCTVQNLISDSETIRRLTTMVERVLQHRQLLLFCLLHDFIFFAIILSSCFYSVYIIPHLKKAFIFPKINFARIPFSFL